ncbi:MAG: SIR2 family protein [Holosporales bacterium]|jgi:hypothetical protein
MLKNKTTLILGAGASYHYGFPTGETLIREVCEEAKKFINLIEASKIPQHPFANNFTFQCFSNIYHGDTSPLPGGHYKHDERRNKAAVLQQEISTISEKIISLDPLNIDTFLRDQPSLQKIGTFLITLVLLKCESKCKKVPEKDYTQKKSNNPDTELGHWYRFLLHVLTTCDDTQALKNIFLNDQKLSIITFNYDVSLEYHLYNSLKKIEKFQDVAASFMKNFSEKCIFHVYGALHTIQWDAEDPFSDFGTPYLSNNNDDDFKKKIQLAVKCSKNIQTIYANKENPQKEQIVETIRNTKDLFILGFGFDDRNITELSGTSKNHDHGLREALTRNNDQRVFMTNYNESKRIENKIDRKNNRVVSPKNVYNALMHDFNFI